MKINATCLYALLLVLSYNLVKLINRRMTFLLSIDLATCGVTGSYVISIKKALAITLRLLQRYSSIVKCVCLLPKT